MKKAYLLAALVVSLHTASLAGVPQGVADPTTTQQRAIKLTRSMAEKMRLDEGQYLKLKQINIKMLVEMDNIKTQYAASPAALDEHLAALQTQYQQETTNLLRPTQLFAFRQLQDSRTALNLPKE